MTDVDFAKLELLVLDVDGVLTDGRITLDASGGETKTFHAHDGAGIKYWRRVGRKVAFITGRGSEAVERRARELSVDAVRLNIKDKLPALREVCRELDVPPERAVAVGDDLTDLPVMREVGFSVAVADAVDEVRRAADFVTQRPGGAGAVREVIEMILKEARLWESVLARYAPR